MKTIYTLILFLLTGAVYGQSNLPACPALDNSQTGIKRTQSWNNCVGRYAHGDGFVYQGEYKNGVPNGYGTATFANGDKYVGEFKDGKQNGQGTFYYLADDQFKGDKYVGEFNDGQRNGQGTYYRVDGRVALGEWKDGKPHGRFIAYKSDKSVELSGIFEDGKFVQSQHIDPKSFTRIAQNSVNPPPADNSTAEKEQLERERQRLAEERRRLEEEKRQREQAKQSSRISIVASATQPDSNGVVTINIQTNTDTSSLKINGDEIGGKSDGIYSVKRIARVGQETKFALVATDVYGNTDSKIITVVRQAADSKAVFGQLNAANVTQQPVRDAVAIIIGIERYKRVAKADYANADAQDFYDYASRALGIKPENIKLLVDEGADDVEILGAFKNWLPLKVKKQKTDVYIFYSGHGLPSDDGKSLYLMPFSVDKNFIERTAINQLEIIAALQAAQPKSVTMFLDSCYSGQTRSGETLLASARPIAMKASDTAYPTNFTVISASAPDQLSSSSPDLKHGIFSYYLMKGMEGDADLNKDGKITVAEMQEYLTDVVGRQAMGMNRKQQPQLFGDPERVIVGN